MNRTSHIGYVRALLLALASALIIGALVAQPRPRASGNNVTIAITAQTNDNKLASASGRQRSRP